MPQLSKKDPHLRSEPPSNKRVALDDFPQPRVPWIQDGEKAVVYMLNRWTAYSG